MKVFETDFTDAESDLVPPWSTISVDAGNALTLEATQGYLDSAGMKAVMGGTNNSAVAVRTLGTAIDIEGAEGVPYLSWRMNVQTNTLTNSQRPVVARIRLGSTAILDYKLFQNVATLQYSLEDRVGTGGTVDSVVGLTPGTWYLCRIEPDRAANAWKLFVDGTLRVTVNVGSALSNIDQIRIGPQGGAVPPILFDIRYDDIEWDDGVTFAPPGAGAMMAGVSAPTKMGTW